MLVWRAVTVNSGWERGRLKGSPLSDHRPAKDERICPTEGMLVLRLLGTGRASPICYNKKPPSQSTQLRLYSSHLLPPSPLSISMQTNSFAASTKDWINKCLVKHSRLSYLIAPPTIFHASLIRPWSAR